MNRSVRIIWGLALLIVSCKPTATDRIKSSNTGDAFGGAKCSAVRPPTEPDLMAWDPASRLNLKRLRSKGVVAVHYEAEGCNVSLELLSNCIGEGTYEYTPYSANEHKVAHDANELYAQLPIGAASLTGKVKDSNALRTDYMLVGQYALPPGKSYARSELKGSGCERATHVVSATYVGGFAMVVGASQSIDGAASVFGLGAGGSTSSDFEHVADEGDAEACKQAQKSQVANGACEVPLRIALIALAGEPTSSKVPAAPTVAGGGVAPASPKSSSTTCPAGMKYVTAGRVSLPGSGKYAEIPAFCYDTTEVTVDAYGTCVKSGGCTADGLNCGTSPNYGKADRGNHPINCVDWGQAATYCNVQGKRLPTENEFKYASTAGKLTQKYPWGDDEPAFQVCWSGISKRTGTCPVGSFPTGASFSGVLDLAGNVQEWIINSDKLRWAYGGTFMETAPPWGLVVGAGSGYSASERKDYLGFRCVKSLP